MNKKNVLFWVGVKSTDPLLQEKHGGFKYLDISKECWQKWCEKNDVVFFEYNTPTESDTSKHKVTWQRWFDVIPQIEEAGIDYNKIALIDGSTLCNANTPNFFELCDERVAAFRSLENLRWIAEGIKGYNEFFNKFDFDLTKYISCGFQIFGKEHKDFLIDLKDFYYKNYNEIMAHQNGTVKRGTDQPVYNYLLQIKGIDVNMDLPPSLMLTHLTRFDWFGHNWQLKEDTTPFFIKYGHIFFYSGFPNRGDRYEMMKQTWNIIKGDYE